MLPARHKITPSLSRQTASGDFWENWRLQIKEHFWFHGNQNFHWVKVVAIVLHLCTFERNSVYLFRLRSIINNGRMKFLHHSRVIASLRIRLPCVGFHLASGVPPTSMRNLFPLFNLFPYCLRNCFTPQRQTFATMTSTSLQPPASTATPFLSVKSDLTLKIDGVPYLLIDRVGHCSSLHWWHLPAANILSGSRLFPRITPIPRRPNTLYCLPCVWWWKDYSIVPRRLPLSPLRHRWYLSAHLSQKHYLLWRQRG